MKHHSIKFIILGTALAMTLLSCGSSNSLSANKNEGPDGYYSCRSYADIFENGRLVKRIWSTGTVGPMEVPMEEVNKVEMVIGSRDKVARALKGLNEGVYFIELNQMRDSTGNDVDLWELCATKDIYTWLASKQFGSNFAVNAEFEGGTEALADWISENMRYPEQARRDSIGGTIFVSFIVEADGSINPESICANEVLGRKSSGDLSQLKEEAIRLVSTMPRWKPATFMKKPTRSQFHLPITFTI